jgi:shikimate kinase
MRIYLIGFMGSGKTYWGKMWAEYAKMRFVDLDEVIENSEKKSISAIFEKKGESYFRMLESDILRETIHEDDVIIACGGGTACFYDNINWMNQYGVSVYLKADAPSILSNVMNELDKRPLLKKLNQAELLFFIEQKLREREPFYSKAKIQLPISALSKDTIGTIINNHNR